MIIIGLLVILVIYLDYTSGYIIETTKKPKKNRDECIVDMLQDNLPDLSNSKILNKHLRTGLSKNILSIDDILAIIMIFMLFYIHKTKYIKDIAILYIITGSFRLITKNITILPQACKYCKSPEKRTMIDRCITGGCNDSIFSGHTTLMLFILLYIGKGIKNIYVKFMLLLFAIGYSLLIIMLRNHYSVDIVLAWYVSITSFILYENRSKLNYLFA